MRIFALVDDWKFVTLKSYTAIAFYALAVVTALPDLIYLLLEIDTNPAVWTLLQYAVIAFGVVGRVVKQGPEGARIRKLLILGLAIIVWLAAFPALAKPDEKATMRVLVPLVMKWEGEHRCRDDRSMHCAYRDIVGVVTICYGETKGVEMGDRASDDECRDMLRARLAGDFRPGLHRYFEPVTLASRLPPERDAAYVSLAYNVGIRGAGRSTATRRLNRGDIEGGCHAIGWWNKAGGRVVRGLVNRRSEEVELCLRGL